jgi:Flp pilus assembly protein TadD
VEELFRGALDDVHRLTAEGRQLLESGSYNTAKAKFRLALTLNPFHLAAVEGLAEAHERLGNREEVDRYRQRAGLLRRQA